MNPSTADGWLYAQVKDPQLASSLLRQVGVIYCADSYTAELHGLGACFRVHNSRDIALCITAAHVLEEARKYVKPAWLRTRPLTDWPESARAALAAGLSVYFGDLPCGTAPRVEGYHLNFETDLAHIVVRLPHEVASPPPSVFAIDSDLYPAGTRLVAACVADARPIEIPGRDDGRVYKLNAALELRAGTVTRSLVRGRLQKTPVYETSIPTLPGMSGGPVFLAPSPERQSIRVLGVISSDHSTEAAHTTPGTTGSSLVIPIGCAYAMQTSIEIDGQAAEFGALCRTGAVIDLGSRRDRILVCRDGEKFSLQLPGRA
jgi:hypothetical protein